MESSPSRVLLADLVGSEAANRRFGHGMTGRVPTPPDPRRRDATGIVAIEEAPWGRKWKVGTAEGGHQHPGGVRLSVPVLAQPRQRLADHHLLLQQRLGYLADPRVQGARAHGHARLSLAIGQLVERIELMSGWTAKIAVGPRTESSVLQGSSQVHLSDRGRSVPVPAQVGADSWNFLRQDRTVPPGATAMGVASRQHGDSAWRAQRHLAVGGVAVRALVYEAVEGGSVAGLTSAPGISSRQKAETVFVAKEQENVEIV